MAKQKTGRGKYSKEIEEIRRLRDLNSILKAGDLENALLSNSAKESEPMNENVLDDLLQNANREERAGGRSLEEIEKLTMGSVAGTPSKKSAGSAKAKRTAKKTMKSAKKKGRK